MIWKERGHLTKRGKSYAKENHRLWRCGVEVYFNWTEHSLGCWPCLRGSSGHSAQDAGWEFTPTGWTSKGPGSNLEGGLIPGGGSGNTQQINQICRFSSIPQTLRFGYNSNRRSVYSVHQNEIKRQHVNILELGDSQGRPRRGSKRLLRISRKLYCFSYHQIQT